MFTLLKARKSISKAISMLVSTNKKVFSKYQILPVLFYIEYSAITIPYIFKTEPSIFHIPISIRQIKKLNLAANSGVMILTLLPELIKPSI